jgi:hypothetical protein
MLAEFIANAIRFYRTDRIATELHCFLVIDISLVMLHAFGAGTCFAVSVKRVASGLCTMEVPEEMTTVAACTLRNF